MNRRFVSSFSPPDERREPAYWFIFRGNRLLVRREGNLARIPCRVDLAELGMTAVRQQYLGFFDEQGERIHCYVAEITRESDESMAPAGMTFQGLRRLFGQLDDDLLWVGARAFHIVNWDRTHQYCGRCGAATRMKADERARQCPQCHLVSYPRISPAIIVSVERVTKNGPELLLARSLRFRSNLYSVLAGFVEPGETLEDCVRREIKEEVGIEVKNIRYFGSQPWPFPDSLMVAFTAEYASGDIVLAKEELADAKWFTAAAFPQIPSPISIARRLIDAFVARHAG